jgi:hypothetical protein
MITSYSAMSVYVIEEYLKGTPIGYSNRGPMHKQIKLVAPYKEPSDIVRLSNNMFNFYVLDPSVINIYGVAITKYNIVFDLEGNHTLHLSADDNPSKFNCDYIRQTWESIVHR